MLPQTPGQPARREGAPIANYSSVQHGAEKLWSPQRTVNNP